MSDAYPARTSLDRLAETAGSRVWALVLVGLAGIAAGLLSIGTVASPYLVVAGGAVLVLSGVMASLRLFRGGARNRLMSVVTRAFEADATPVFATDAQGAVTFRNAASRERWGPFDRERLHRALSGAFASPASVMERLLTQAAARGASEEVVATRSGQLRLAAHRLGPDDFVWRFEVPQDGGGFGGLEAVAIPVLTATPTGTILDRNRAMRELIGSRGGTLAEVVGDLPLRQGEAHVVFTPSGPVRLTAYEEEGVAGRREIYFLPARHAASAPDWHFFDALPVPLLKIARSGEVELANRLARDLLDEQMAVGAPMSSLVEGLGRPVSEWIADAVEGRGLNRPEVVRASRPAQEVFLQITLGRIEDEGEVALVAVLNDATELKTLEAQFVQSQKMQAIGQLAGGVAHDFNNLLTAISGHCDLLLLRHDAGDPDYADLSQIAQNANRAASLVGQLLAFSRKQNLQPQMLDLRDSLSDLTHLLNRLVGEKVTLQVRHDPDVKVIRADKRQLEQVMMNLVVNARDAMPAGGKVEISTHMRRYDKPLERDRAIVPPGEYVEVRVEDQGTGIPPDKLPKIFEPFFTTKRTGEGTGLGLSTAYGIVKQTGGFIFADSTVGEGTTFCLLFPAHDAPVSTAEVAPSRHARGPAQGEGVILLVEDEAPVRAFASRALRMKGYTVLEAENAEDALQMLEDSQLAVDLFVTDVIMPGMDGPTWVRRALETRPDTRIVFVSGYAEDGFADDRARIPNSTFLPKPFSLNDLVATVDAELGPTDVTGG